MAVEVKLEPKGAPRGYTQIAETKSLIDEIEIIVEAFPTVRLEKCSMGCLIVPRLIRRTRLHRRQDVDKTGVAPPLGKNLLDPRFLAKRRLAHELDLESVLLSQPLGIGANLVAQRLGKPCIVEDPDL